MLGSSFTAEDEDILGAEEAYAAPDQLSKPSKSTAARTDRNTPARKAKDAVSANLKPGHMAH